MFRRKPLNLGFPEKEVEIQLFDFIGFCSQTYVRMRMNKNIIKLYKNKKLISLLINFEIMLRKNIINLRNLFADEIYSGKEKFIHEDEIRLLISQINAELIENYEDYKTNVATLLKVYDEVIGHSIPYLMPEFYNGLMELKEMESNVLDLSFFKQEVNDQEIDHELSEIFMHIAPGIQEIHMSKDIELTVSLEKGYQFLHHIHRNIAEHIRTKSNVETDNNILIQLWMARAIAKSIGRTELFYLLVSMFLDMVHLNENYQFARDIAEDSLRCSYKDGFKELGYYIFFRVYSTLSNSVSALHYANCAMMLFKEKGVINDFVLKSFFAEAIKYFRNIKVVEYAIEMFKNRPTTVIYSQYEENKFHNLYFSCLLYSKDSTLPDLVLSYLDTQKENILRHGEPEALPWLATLLNIKKNYLPEEYNLNSTELYIQLFRMVVSPSNYKRLFIQLFGSLEQLKARFKDAMLKLSYTRTEEDFSTDNKLALQISHSLIEESFKHNDVEGFLLSMILQSDLTTTFKNKLLDTERFAVDDLYQEKIFETEYQGPEDVLASLCKIKDVQVLWLGTDKTEVFPVIFKQGEFKFIKENKILLSGLKLSIGKLLHKLPLNEYNKEKNRYKVFEDYEKEKAALFEEVKLLSIKIQPEILLLVKDIELSLFPHNLLVSERGFLAENTCIANIMSLDWLAKNYNRKSIMQNSRSIWFPIKSGDFRINMMYEKMDSTLKYFNFKESTEILPYEPLDSDLNILVAHGNDEISTFPSFFLNGENQNYTIQGIDHMVGQGCLLVLFVCHSGSEKSDIFRNKVSTIIKGFLNKGYTAVIAPFWGLNIEVPPIWLPVFLESLQGGLNVGQSYLAANKKVAETYNTPNAFSCLHFYGNPFIKLAKSEIE